MNILVGCDNTEVPAIYNLRSTLLSAVYLDCLTSITIAEVIYYSILSQMTLFDCWNWVCEL